MTAGLVASVAGQVGSYTVVAAVEEDDDTGLAHLLELGDHFHIVLARIEARRRDYVEQAQVAKSLSKDALALPHTLHFFLLAEKMDLAADVLEVVVKVALVAREKYAMDMVHDLKEDMAEKQMAVAAAECRVIDAKKVVERPRLARHMDLVLGHSLMLRVWMVMIVGEVATFVSAVVLTSHCPKSFVSLEEK